MTEILIALLIGVIAGLIDIFPMVKRPIPRESIIATFAQWVLLGLVIPFVSWPTPTWLTGAILGLLGMAPSMIVAHKRNPSSVIPTAVFGVALGAGIGALAPLYTGGA